MLGRKGERQNDSEARRREGKGGGGNGKMGRVVSQQTNWETNSILLKYNYLASRWLILSCHHSSPLVSLVMCWLCAVNI